MKVGQSVDPVMTESAVRCIADGAYPRDLAGDSRIETVSHLPGVRRITALPDFAVNGPEKADSWVVQLDGRIVPALATNIVNCGMGLINTGLNADDLDEREMKSYLHKVWRISCSEDYTLSPDQVDDLFLEGVGALTRRGLLREHSRQAFEFGGSIPTTCLAEDLDALIPLLLRRLPATRRPSRLQLQGNHFVELQVVDQVVDMDRLREFGLKKGQLVLMLHMDHQITGNINLHYVLRNMYFHKPWAKRTAYFLSKAWFHFGRPVGWAAARQRWQTYFSERDYVGIPADSSEGRRYLAAYNLTTNYGYGARAVIYRMLADVLQEEFGQRATPQLICDTNHESIRLAGDNTVVIRRGAVECIPSRPAVIAGSYNVPSLLGECLGSEETAFSYDHGSANFRRALGTINGQYGPSGATAKRYLISGNGNGSADSREEHFPVLSQAPMEALSGLLQAHQAVRPVAWLRPVANLSQR